MSEQENREQAENLMLAMSDLLEGFLAEHMPDIGEIGSMVVLISGQHEDFNLVRAQPDAVTYTVGSMEQAKQALIAGYQADKGDIGRATELVSEMMERVAGRHAQAEKDHNDPESH